SAPPSRSRSIAPTAHGSFRPETDVAPLGWPLTPVLFVCLFSQGSWSVFSSISFSPSFKDPSRATLVGCRSRTRIRTGYADVGTQGAGSACQFRLFLSEPGGSLCPSWVVILHSCYSIKVVFFFANNEHRTWRCSGDAFGCAADREMPPPCESMGCDHDKVDIK